MIEQIQDLNLLEIDITERLLDERNSLNDFLQDKYNDPDCYFIKLGSAPGIGKSHACIELIRANQQDKFVIIVPNHELGEEWIEKLDFLEEWEKVQLVGKTYRKKYLSGRLGKKECMRPNHEEYVPGCHDCEYNGFCIYKKKREYLEDRIVVVCTLQTLKFAGQDRNIIFDESFDQLMMETKVINNSDILKYGITFGNKVKKKLGKETITFYKSVIYEDIEVKTEKDYFLDLFLSNVNMIQTVKNIENKNNYTLFGLRTDYMPDEYQKIIFNCATTPTPLMCRITETEHLGINEDMGWDIYKPKHFKIDKLDNPILKFNLNWSRNKSKTYLMGLKRRIRKSAICDTLRDLHILIVTKLEFVLTFRTIFKNCDVTYYGKGRGYNKFNKKYDLIMQYGRFGFTPLNREMWAMIGFNDDLVNQMELSEMRQCLHRGRPLLHPEVPILSITDKNILSFANKISSNRLNDFLENPQINVNGLTANEINFKLGYSRSSKVYKDFKLISNFFDGILYGGK